MGKEVLRTLLAICTGVWGILKKPLGFTTYTLKQLKKQETSIGRGVLMAILAMCIGVWVILKKALEYFNPDLKITKEVGDKHS